MRRGPILLSALLLLLSGCSSPLSLELPTEHAPLGYRLEIGFSSRIPEDYYVLSGPAETYQRLQVNDRFRTLLKRYEALRSSGDGGESIRVAVELREVTTRYESLGTSVWPRLPEYAHAERARFQLLSGLDNGGEPGHLPLEIIKTLTLKTAVQIDPPGAGGPREEILVVEETTREELPDYDVWTFDYAPLLNRALSETLLRIDALIRQAVPDQGSS